MALETEIRAYEAKREELERDYKRKFVVFHGEDFVGAFDTFDAAARVAVRQFGRGPYLIRQVGVKFSPLPPFLPGLPLASRG